MADIEHYVAAARQLRAAVERTAGALAGAQLADLLDAERQLADALASVPAAERRPAGDRQALERELTSLRLALVRCRRLGQALNEFVRLSFAAQGQTSSYDQLGGTPAGPSIRVLETRV